MDPQVVTSTGSLKVATLLGKRRKASEENTVTKQLNETLYCSL